MFNEVLQDSIRSLVDSTNSEILRSSMCFGNNTKVQTYDLKRRKRIQLISPYTAVFKYSVVCNHAATVSGF
jgi:hypothetical protein